MGNTMSATHEILRQALQAGFNVLVEGAHGTGKTSMLLTVCQELHLRVKYFSASTLDPFVDLIGIPVPVAADDGQRDLLYHRPRNLLDAEVLFFDELNRAHPKVLNAVLEIVQFRSLNGDRLPGLKAVVAACNPVSEKYQTLELDAALVDRFMVHVKFVNSPCEAWFIERFPKMGQTLCAWWNADLDDAQRQEVSPRKLEHIGILLETGLDPACAMPSRGVRLPFHLLAGRIANANAYDISDFVGDPGRFAAEVRGSQNIALRFVQILPLMKPEQMYAVRDIVGELSAEHRAALAASQPFVFKKLRSIIETHSGVEEANLYDEIWGVRPAKRKVAA